MRGQRWGKKRANSTFWGFRSDEKAKLIQSNINSLTHLCLSFASPHMERPKKYKTAKEKRQAKRENNNRSYFKQVWSSRPHALLTYVILEMATKSLIDERRNIGSKNGGTSAVSKCCFICLLCPTLIHPLIQFSKHTVRS